MPIELETRYGIRDLSQASGVPRRTIRYYVQIGLLEPPLGAGRGHYYLPRHLERLVRIRELREQGWSLGRIGRRLDSGGPIDADPIDATTTLHLVTRVRLADGVELLVSHGARAPSASQIRELAASAARILGQERQQEGASHE